MTQRTKITVDLRDDELYRAIKIAAIEHKSSLRQVVIEALKEWLRRQEESEDLEDYRKAKELYDGVMKNSSNPVNKYAS